MSDSPIPKLPQVQFDQIKPAPQVAPMGPYPVAQPQIGNVGASPTHATMPDVSNWASLLAKAPTPQDALKQQEQGQKNQGYNALARLMADPQNRAPGGGLTQNAMAQLYGASPQIGMEYEGVQGEIAQQRQRAELAGQKVEQEQISGLTDRLSEALIPEYDENVKKFGQERAHDIYLKHRKELLDQEKQSGSLLPKIVNRLRYDTPPETLRANALGLKDMQARQDKANQFEVRTDHGKSGGPVEYRLYPDGRATDITGKAPYTPTGVAEFKGSEAKIFVGQMDDGKGGSREVRYQYGAGGALDVDTRQPIDTTKLLKGSVRLMSTKGEDTSAAMDAETLGTMADQYIAGDRTVMQNIGRGTQGSKNISALRGEIAKRMAERGLSGADMAARLAEYDGMKAGCARSARGRRIWNWLGTKRLN
jgi:hypothetical protein